MSNAAAMRLMEWVKAGLKPNTPAPAWSTGEDGETGDLILRNRLGALLDPLLGRAEGVPGALRMDVGAQARQSFLDHERRARGFHNWMPALPMEGWCMLRGPALGASVYHDPVLRPYMDLDILLRPEDVDSFLDCLDGLGFVAPVGSYPDAYYRRHHFHLQRVYTGGDFPVLLELHWALDHQWNFHQPPPSVILDHCKSVDLAGVKCPVPEPTVWWLLLALHLSKHLPALPQWAASGEAWRLVGEGELLHLMDLALLVSRIDRDRGARLAAEWGCEDEWQGGLHAIAQLWPERMPHGLAPFQPRRPRRAVASPDRANVSRQAVMRPARCVEIWQGIWPEAATRKRISGNNGGQLSHALRYAGKAVHAAVETLWWGLQSKTRKRSP